MRPMVECWASTQKHRLEDELMADAYGDGWQEQKRTYWLNHMVLWVWK
jgi:hypothetical protein